MGGGGSKPRRITVEEDELTGMVKVSENVAKRLMGEPESDVTHDRSGQGIGLSSEERDKEIMKLEKVYKDRINSLEQKNQAMYDETKEQFARAVEEVEQKFLKTTASPICQELQEQVLKCYQANPKYSLYCSAQVRAFNECVQRQREKILTRKG